MPHPANPSRVVRFRLPGLLGIAAPILLAGLLPVSSDVSSRWGWSGSWLHPVGDPYVAPAAEFDSAEGYRAMRSVSEPGPGQRGHQGADLSNGSGGGPVRAAGGGLVVKVGGKGWNRGYGRHVVIAHQMIDGGLVYSVYAHLAPGSVTVRRGEYVGAGRQIGRVGMTGRATSPHLHFEVRRPDDPTTRWENAPVVDPLEFVALRLATRRPDSTWTRPYLEWAECAALIRPGDEGDGRPTRAEWWRALVLATRHPLGRVPASGESLRSALIEMKILPEKPKADPDARMGWDDLVRDVTRARAAGLRLPWSPVAREPRRMDCRRELRTATPAHEPESLVGARDRGPTRAEMCLVLADLAGDPPARPPRAKPASKPKPKAKPVPRTPAPAG